MTKKLILDRLERFLKERRQSTGGYAEVRPEDMVNLERLVQGLIELKFEEDPDGDLPVEFKLVDRTKFEPMHFEPVPYLGIARSDSLTPAQKQDIFDTHMMNLSIAHNRLETPRSTSIDSCQSLSV